MVLIKRVLLTGASVFRHFLDVQRVFVSEPESENATPVVGYLQKLDVHFLVDGYRSTAERYTFAKTVHSPGDKAIFVQSNVLTVYVVESQRRQIWIYRAGARFWCCKPNKRTMSKRTK